MNGCWLVIVAGLASLGLGCGGDDSTDANDVTSGDDGEAEVLADGDADIADLGADADVGDDAEAGPGEDAAVDDGSGPDADAEDDGAEVPDPCEGVDCSSLDGACVVGVCDPATGACGTAPRADGIPCDDRDDCTEGDACRSGVCRGTRPGDTCAEALPIAEISGLTVYPGDLSCARNDYRLSCGRTAFGTLPEVVYRMELTVPRTLSLFVDRAYRETLELRGADCAAGPALACDTDGGSPETDRTCIFGYYPPGVYHVFVKREDPGPYELNVLLDPEDYCEHAIDLGDLTTSVGVGSGGDTDTTAAIDDVSTSCGGAGASDEMYRFRLSSRTLLRVELWSDVALVAAVARGSCPAGPLGADEAFCAAGTPIRAFLVLEPGDYSFLVDGATPGTAGPYGFTVHRVWGDVVLIGHDYSARHPSTDALLVNAVLTAEDFAVIDVLEYVQYVDVAPGGEAANARAAIAAGTSPPSLRAARFETLEDAGTLAARLPAADVLLIHEQELRPDTATLDAIGAAWAAVLPAWVENGGTVILLDSAPAETWRLLAPSGLVPGLGAGTAVTGARLAVVSAGDEVARGVTTPYTAPVDSTTFAVATGTSVVQESATGATVVLHRALP